VTVATIVVDMQVDFFALERLAANRPQLARNTNALAAMARENGGVVVSVRCDRAIGAVR
jgi:nicotinamidase-related amidase